jgi:hypothetical protein
MIRQFTHWLADKRELLSVGAPLRVGPTATLALGIYHCWQPDRQVFVIVTAYGDESGTHAGSPIQMLAGYVATLGEWNKFDPKWRRAITRAGLPGYFHGTEHWNTEAGRKFAPLAAKLNRKYLRFGYVVELDKESYERHYVAGNRPRKPQLDTRYGVCFRFLLTFLLTRLPILLEREDLTLNIVLEEGAAGSEDSIRIVQQLRKQPETQDLMRMLGGVSFQPKARFPGLQVSDSLAFGSLKIAPAGLPLIDIPQDAPLSESQKTLGYKPAVYHCRLDEVLLGALKSDISALVEIRRRMADGIKNH